MNYTELPSTEIINKTAKALEKNGMRSYVVETAQEASDLILKLLPKGAEIMDMTSETLNSLGISDIIQNSGNYISARKKAYALDQKKDAKEIHQYRSIPDWTIGSIHALTEDGTIMVASQSGSQLAAYSFGSDNVIFVVGAQKIVKDLETGFKRLYEHALPLETNRAQKAYGVESSAINKIFILKEEINADRIQVVLVNQALGF